ncbi:MAG: hypothetical protein HYT70_00220 [Candidatus Aenigmarchaeota archaeon]|nr:hypothetical protein [Candidatus Aenigmarchaeota archaeon]
MKGQVFLLTAGIVIGILVALKGYSIVSQITTEREILDVSLEDLAFKNVDNEIKRIAVIVSSSPNTMSDNAIDFLNFTRNGASSHSNDFRAVFVSVLANSTNQTMNITVFNFLRESNLNFTIELNTSTVQRNSTFLNDSGVWFSNFSFTRGETYDLTLTLPSKDYVENITVQTRGGKDTYTAFYDISLITIRATHNDKFQQRVKIG